MTPPQSIDELYRAAIRLHQRGRGNEAGALYDEILSQQPDHPGALHLKGVLALQAGDKERARASYARALEIDDRNPRAREGFGRVEGKYGTSYSLTQ